MSSSGFGKSIKVIPFDGKKSNFRQWTGKFLAASIVRGYNDILIGKVKAPIDSEVIKDDDKVRKKAQEDNQKAYTDLILSMEDKVAYAYVDGSKTDDITGGDAKLAWDRLQRKYRPKTNQQRVSLRLEFQQNTLKSWKVDPDEWITELEIQKVYLKEMGVAITEDELKLHIITNLPEEYDILTEQLEENMDTLDLEEIRERLIAKFEKIKKRKGGWSTRKMKSSDEETAFINGDHNDDAGVMTDDGFIHEAALITMFKGRCYKCGNFGHKSADCPTKIGDSKSNQRGNSNPSNDKPKKFRGKCWKCGKYGHSKRDCTQNDASNIANDEDNDEEVIAFCTFIVDTNDHNEAATKIVDFETDEVALVNNDYTFASMPPDLWIGDTGASSHMTNSLEGLINLRASTAKVTVGDGEQLECEQVGDKTGVMELKNGEKKRLLLKDVKYVPKLHCNLISVSKLMSEGKELRGTKHAMKLYDGKRPVMTFDRKVSSGKGILYGIKIGPPNLTLMKSRRSHNGKIMINSRKISSTVAHRRLGHIGGHVLNATAKNLGWKLVGGVVNDCESCAIAKAKQKNVPKFTEKRNSKPGEDWSVDISSIKSQSAGGAKFWGLWVDRCTGYKKSFFLKTKKGQVQLGVDFVQQLKQKNGIQVKSIRADNAGENKKLETALVNANLGAQFEYTASRSPQQNGAVERSFATLYGRVRAMFHGCGMDQELRGRLWAEAGQTATLLDNLLIMEGKQLSRTEELMKFLPDYSSKLRTFGEMGVLLKPDPGEHHGKMKDRGLACVFVGYCPDHASGTYRMYNLSTKKVIVTRDVKWLNKLYAEWSKATLNVELESESDSDEENADTKEKQDSGRDDGDSVKSSKLDRELRKLYTTYNPTTVMAPEVVECAFVGGTLEGHDNPRSFQEAWHHPDPVERKHWRDAIRKEFRCMIEKGVWRKVKSSSMGSDRRLVGCVWVFKKKKNGVYRARLCAQGFTQVPGIDHKDNFSPVVTDVTFRVVMVLAFVFGWIAEIVDVETAFLYGELEEEIYMRIPIGLSDYLEGENCNGECLLLLKGIYGLVQSARQFFKKILEVLTKKMNFIKCLSDQCLLYRRNENGTVIICLYIDDTLVVGDRNAVDLFKKEIKNFFSTKEEGTMEEFVGCKVLRPKPGRGLFYQDDLIKKIEDHFGTEAKKMRKYKTPAGPGDRIVRPTIEDTKISLKDQTKFRSGVGMLLYLVKFSRPDICNAVRELSKVNDGATIAHYKELLRCIKFILDTRNRMLCYDIGDVLRIKDFSEFKMRLSLTAFCDSDYAGDTDNRKSVTAYAIYFQKCLVAYKSRSQKTVSLSSTEAEFNAIGEICIEISFIKNIVEFMGITIELPITVFCDNVGAIFMSYNAKTSPRTKHVAIKRLFVREFIEDGDIIIKFVRSENNDSDIWSKNTSVATFERHSNKFMVYHDANE